VGWGEGKGSIPLDSVLDTIYRRRRWVEAVVLKGGEPLAHPELPDFLELLKDFGLLVRVDTNGTRPDALENLIRREVVDYVALEIKGPLSPAYARTAGTAVDLAALYRSIEILLSGESEYEFTTAVRDDLLTAEDVLSVARTIQGAERYVLRPVAGRGPSRNQLRALARRAGRYVRSCHVAGSAPERDTRAVTAGEGGR
jgi:pyruvate formate lyase activating enzyme